MVEKRFSTTRNGYDRAVPAGRNRSIVVPLAGATLVLIYILLSGIQPYQSTAGRNFHFISPDELRFWLAHWMLATPGIMLIAVDQGSHTFRYVWRRLLSLPSRQWHLVGLCYFGALAGLAVAGRSVFLLNLPITDDENTVLFGAQMWLNGELSVPILEPDGAFTQAFTYRHAGRTSAMAFPGDILFRAVSLATGLGTALYALAAGATGLAVAAAGRLLAERRGAIVAACLWVCSPMAFSLSMTTHSHLVSRCFLAVAVWLYLRLMEKPSRGAPGGALLALAGGMAFLTRTPEAACVLLPISAHLLMTAFRDPHVRRATIAAAVTSLSVVAFYGWYNQETTGAWYLLARLGPGVHHVTTDNPDGTVFTRFGFNFGHNFLLLLVMALGPLGAILVALGFKRQNTFIVLSLGVALQLALTLLYNDTGIHTVGPIHFSETLPVLVLLAAAGLLRLISGLRDYGVPTSIPTTAIVAYVLGGLSLFSVIHAFGLRNQATNSALIYEAVAAADLHNALVIGDKPVALIHSHPDLRLTGSWVHWFPPPDPYLRDDVIFAYADADLDVLRRRLPGRSLYRMTYHLDGSPVRISEIK